VNGAGRSAADDRVGGGQPRSRFPSRRSAPFIGAVGRRDVPRPSGACRRGPAVGVETSRFSSARPGTRARGRWEPEEVGREIPGGESSGSRNLRATSLSPARGLRRVSRSLRPSVGRGRPATCGLRPWEVRWDSHRPTGPPPGWAIAWLGHHLAGLSPDRATAWQGHRLLGALGWKPGAVSRARLGEADRCPAPGACPSGPGAGRQDGPSSSLGPVDRLTSSSRGERLRPRSSHSCPARFPADLYRRRLPGLHSDRVVWPAGARKGHRTTSPSATPVTSLAADGTTRCWGRSSGCPPGQPTERPTRDGQREGRHDRFAAEHPLHHE
jgi:hypothetical protein